MSTALAVKSAPRPSREGHAGPQASCSVGRTWRRKSAARIAVYEEGLLVCELYVPEGEQVPILEFLAI